MKQLKSINQLKELFPKVSGIEVALLYGSFGRNEPSPNSDIDIQLLIGNDFNTQIFKDELFKVFNSEIESIREIKLRKKIVLYFKAQPKIEFSICTNISDIDKHYLGSEIININNTILYESNLSKLEIETYLNNLVRDFKNNNDSNSNEKSIADLIDKFVYEFESCSTMHRRSDGYQFYFFYNLALQVVIQLNQLSKGDSKFNFLPKSFIANVLTKKEQGIFYDLKGTLFLPEANKQKRILLDFFYSTIEKIIGNEKLIEIKKFCEWLYERDFMWNFRDISLHNPKIKSGIIYRSSTMTFLQNEGRFDSLLKSKNIKTIIDLRADREIEELPYTEESISKFNYVKTPFDPWNQPDWFKEKHNQGTNDEIAYRFFTIGCNDKIKQGMEAILDEQKGSVAIHCFAGKDRTGILITMLHLLVDTPIEIINSDYLASEIDVNVNRLSLAIDIINQKGGIVPYLLSCGLTEYQIQLLKQKLTN